LDLLRKVLGQYTLDQALSETNQPSARKRAKIIAA
jgi:hypothetical protein